MYSDATEEGEDPVVTGYAQYGHTNLLLPKGETTED